MICQPIKASLQVKAIGWDSETKRAKFTDYANRTHSGLVTASREHEGPNGMGEKLNLVFEFTGDVIGMTSAEFMVFTFYDKFRVIGVGYEVVDGKKLLSRLIGPEDVNCLSL